MPFKTRSLAWPQRFISAACKSLNCGGQVSVTTAGSALKNRRPAVEFETPGGGAPPRTPHPTSNSDIDLTSSLWYPYLLMHPPSHSSACVASRGPVPLTPTLTPNCSRAQKPSAPHFISSLTFLRRAGCVIPYTGPIPINTCRHSRVRNSAEKAATSAHPCLTRSLSHSGQQSPGTHRPIPRHASPACALTRRLPGRHRGR